MTIPQGEREKKKKSKEEKHDLLRENEHSIHVSTWMWIPTLWQPPKQEQRAALNLTKAYDAFTPSEFMMTFGPEWHRTSFNACCKTSRTWPHPLKGGWSLNGNRWKPRAFRGDSGFLCCIALPPQWLSLPWVLPLFLFSFFFFLVIYI